MAPYIVPFIINGEEVIPKDTFEVRSPITGEVVHLCGLATVSEAKAAVDAAAAAGPAWRDISNSARRDILLKAAELLDQRRPELDQYLLDETGQPASWSAFNLDLSIDLIKDAAGRLATLEGTVPKLANPAMAGMVIREPYGVVPCPPVFKGSELSPRAIHALTTVFNDAGLPKGVLNFIATSPALAPEVTESIIANPHVKKINFTGSTAVGRIIGRTAGQYLKPVVLELGGKSPTIVWEDANLDLAAQSCALGAFLNSGQICMGTEKIIVHKKISQAFQDKLKKAVAQFFPDALIHINEQAVQKNKRLVQDALDKGASLLLQNNKAEELSKTQLRPIVVMNVTPKMDIYHTESFGATVSLIEVESEEEAVRIANDTEYGLSSSVFTEDLRTGLRFSKQIESGAVHINNMTVHDEVALPHGGAKGSGYGRFNVTLGLEEYVRTKTVTWKI